MPAWIPVSPRLIVATVALALVPLLTRITTTGDAVQASQDASAPRRVKIAATALGAIDRGLMPLADDDARLVRIDPDVATGAAASTSSAKSGGASYVPGRVIVKFRDGSSQSARASTTRAVGARSLPTQSSANFDVLQIDDATSADSVARDLAARADVEYAQPDYRVYPRFQPNDPYYVYQWNYPTIGLEAAWDLTRGGSSSIIVAVLDTGVAFEDATFEYNAPAFRTSSYRYPALGRLTVPFAAAPDLLSDNRFVAPHDFIWGDDDPVDLDGHGTHVAGTIGQLTNNGVGGAGMAFNVRIMPVKVLDGDWDQIFDSPNSGTDGTVAQGIRYAVDNGARVLNLSLGRTGPPSPVMEDALRYAVAHGAVVTIAAGNEFEQGNPDEWPAAYGSQIPGVITVGAVGRDLLRAYYSPAKSYIEVVAPGGNYRMQGRDGLIYQQMYDPDAAVLWPLLRSLPPSQYHAPRFDSFAFVGLQGTSMAAPHVAGLAALLMNMGLTDPAAVEAAIAQAATDLGTAGPDAEYGAGVINSATACAVTSRALATSSVRVGVRRHQPRVRRRRACRRRTRTCRG